MTDEAKPGNGNGKDASPEEREFFKAQAETERFKAEEARIRAEKAGIELNRMRDEDKWMRATNPFHRVYVFDDEVREASVGLCVATLDVWHRIYPNEDLTIQFYSPGGDVIAGMYLFDRIRDMHAQGHRIITEAYGMAASMAGILLQAGDVRRMGREAYILIHQVQFGIRGRFGEVQDELKFVEKIQGRIIDIFAKNIERAAEAGTATDPLTREQLIENWERKDWWLSSNEALQYGIVDEIM